MVLFFTAPPSWEDAGALLTCRCRLASGANTLPFLCAKLGTGIAIEIGARDCVRDWNCCRDLAGQEARGAWDGSGSYPEPPARFCSLPPPMPLALPDQFDFSVRHTHTDTAEPVEGPVMILLHDFISNFITFVHDTAKEQATRIVLSLSLSLSLRLCQLPLEFTHS